MSTISVVLATYNGEKYIEEQLASIKNQTRNLDQVVIVDDFSTDHTVEKIKQFMHDYNLCNWEIIENKENIGWKKNFKKGFDHCNGDYIFPCDQEDIWRLDKIEKIVGYMDDHPSVELMASNYAILNESNLKSSHASTYARAARKMKDDGSIESVKLNQKWFYIQRPGCTYCFKKNFYDEIKAYWNTEWAHDAILWRYACVRKSLYIWNEQLISFRRHDSNVTGRIQNDKNKGMKNIDCYINMHRDILKYLAEKNDCESMKVVENTLEFWKLKKKCTEEKSFVALVKLLVRYHSSYVDEISVLAEIYRFFTW